MPIIKSLAVAVIAAGAAILIFAKLRTGNDVSTLVILGLTAGAALVALVMARMMSLGRAWQVLIVIATPAMVLVPIFQPPTWIFPIVFLGLAGFYINGVREQVPLYLSNRKTQKTLADLVPPDTNVTFIDLGCGLGGIVTYVARARPQARVIGVETAPLSFLIAWMRCSVFAGANAQIRFQSIWDTDISNVDVVYAFLSPAPMTRLNEKIRAEMKPGSRFISNSFAVPGSAPDEIVAVDDTRETQLLIWWQ